MFKIYTRNCFHSPKNRDYTGLFVLVFVLSVLFSFLAFLIAILALCK